MRAPRKFLAFLVLCCGFFLANASSQAGVYWVGNPGDTYYTTGTFGAVSGTTGFSGSPAGTYVMFTSSGAGAGMNISVNQPVTDAAYDAITGGITFAGNAYSGNTGYTLSGTGALTLAGPFVNIDPDFTGNGITENINAPVIVDVASEYIGNYTTNTVGLKSVSPEWLGVLPVSVLTSGTGNTLEISGSVTRIIAGTTYLVGPGNGEIAGNIVTTSTAAANAIPIIVDASGGTWTLSGSNSFDPLSAASTTQVINGTLALDFTGNIVTTATYANSKINPNSQLVLGSQGSNNTLFGSSATLSILGNAAGGSVQGVAGINFQGGANAIVMSGTGGVLNMGGENNHYQGATIDFDIAGGNAAQNASTGIQTLWSNNGSSILAGWATVNQTDWAVSTAPNYLTGVATYSGSNIIGVGNLTNGQMVWFPATTGGLSVNTTYFVVNATATGFQVSGSAGGVPLAVTTGAGGTLSATAGAIESLASYTNDTWATGNNTTVTSPHVFGASAVTNSLRFASTGAGDTLNFVGTTGTITSGGILDSANVVSPMAITGGALYTANQFYINQFSSAPLTISSMLTNNQNVVKSGSGELILSGSNTVSNFYANLGTTQLQNSYALGGTSAQWYIGNAATIDLNGNNVGVKTLNSDTTLNASLYGSAAAAAGVLANVTNSAAGTDATLTIGVSTSRQNVSYYGGFTEAPGAIISLNLFNQGGGPAGPTGSGGNQFGAPTSYSNSPWSTDQGYSDNLITGAITVNRGDNFSMNGAGFLTLGAFNLNGGSLTAGAKGTGLFTTYLTGLGAAYGASGGSFPFGINVLGSLPDVSSIRWGTGRAAQGASNAVPEFMGTGTISFTNPLNINTGGSIYDVAGTGTVIVPSIGLLTEGQNAGATQAGESTFEVTGNTGTPSNPLQVLPGTNAQLNGGAFLVAPSGSGANVYDKGLFAPNIAVTGNLYVGGGGGTILLNAGSNTSVTLTLGQMGGIAGHNSNLLLWRSANDDPTLVIAAAQGFSALGTTDVLNLMSYAPTLAFPTLTNGVAPTWMVGQAANQASLPATYLTYNYTGYTGTNTDAGFTPVVYSGSNTNNINYSNATSAELINAGTQTETTFTSANTVEIDNAAVNTGNANLLANGVILNSGTISGLITGQGLRGNGGDIQIYTSLGGGLISAPITNLTSTTITKFGPGILTLTATNNSYGGGTVIDAGVLDVGTISSGILPTSGALKLRGGVLEGNGNFNWALGTGAGQVSFANNSDQSAGGGFSAYGGALNVALGLSGSTAATNLIWGTTVGGVFANSNNFFLTEGAVLNFGSTISNNVVTFANNIDLGIISDDGNTTLDDYTREISVTGNTSDAGVDPQLITDYTVLTGTISQTNPYHGLAKTGNGVLVLAGNNNYTGATSITAGSLLINADSNLGTAPAAEYTLSTTPGFNGGTITPGSIVINGGATLGSGTATSVTISGNRSILLASGSGTTPSNISVGAFNTLTFGGFIGDYINEYGNLGKTGPGTLVLSGNVNNTFSAGLTISNGTVQDASLDNANVFGAGVVTFSGSNSPTLDLNGSLVQTGLLSGAGNNGVITNSAAAASAILSVSGTGSQTFAGSIQNGGSSTTGLTVVSGIQVLTGNNSYSGATTLNGGELSLGSANAIADTASIGFGGGFLQFTAANTTDYSGIFSTAAGQQFGIDTNGQTVTLASNLTSTGGSLTKIGAGTLILNQTGNSFNGGLTVNNGTVQAGPGTGTAVLGSGIITFGTANTPTVDVNGNSVTVGLLSGAGANGVLTNSAASPVTVTLAGSGLATYGGAIQNNPSGALSVAVTSGSQVLSGSSSYTGSTTVGTASLMVTSTNGLGNTSGLTVNNAGAFNFASSGPGNTLNIAALTFGAGTEAIGATLGSPINITGAVTNNATSVLVNVFASGSTGTSIPLLLAAGGGLGSNYALGDVYGATNFSVGVPSAASGTSVVVSTTAQTALTTAYWTGGYADGNNVWAISSGTVGGRGNWTSALNSGTTELVPGPTTNVFFTGTNEAASASNSTLGMNMAINSMNVTNAAGLTLTDAAHTLTLSGSINVPATAGAVSINTPLVLNGASSQVFSASNPGWLTIGGPISSGTAGITIAGTTKVVLTGANTFTGPISLNGELNATTAGVNGLGSSATNGFILNSGGYLQVATGGITTAKGIYVTGNSTIDTNGNNASITGVIAGSGVGTLTKTGAGTLTINGNNTLPTALTLANGTLQIAANTSGTLTAGIFSFASSGVMTLDLNDNSEIVGNFTDNDNQNGFITNNATDSGTGYLTIPVSSGTLNFGESIQDGITAHVGIVKTGTGLMFMNGLNNLFTGGILIQSGTLQGSTAGNIVDSLGQGIITFGTATGPTGPVFDTNATNGGIVAGLVSGGTNALIVNSSGGASTWTISGAGVATFAGNINQGTSTLAMTMDINSGTQIFTGTSNQTGTITINGGIINTTTAGLNLSNVTNGIALGSQNTGGVLQAGVGGIVTGKTITVAGSGYLDAPLGQNINLTGTITGAGSITKTDVGTLFISGTTNPNPFTGVWNIEGGILNGNTAQLNASSTTNGMFIDGGTLQSGTGGLVVTKTISLSGSNATAGTFDTAGNGMTLNGIISGPGGMVVMSSDNTGTQSLTLGNQTNTFFGPTLVSSGTLILGANLSLENSPINTSGTGVITETGFNTPTFGGLQGSTNLQSVITTGYNMTTITLDPAAGFSNAYSGVIADSGSTMNLVFNGAGTQYLTGSNTYAGTTTIEGGGVLSVSVLNNGGVASGIGQSGSAAANLTLNNGDLQYTGTGASSNRDFTIAANTNTLDASGAGPLVLSNTNAMGIFGTGVRTLVLTGSNTGNNTLAVNIGNNGGNATSVVKTGAGAWVLSGTSGYTGATTVKAGLLLVSGSLGGTTGVTVGDANTGLGATATLGGNGIIAGTLTVGAATGNSIDVLDPSALAVGLSGTETNAGPSLKLTTNNLALTTGANVTVAMQIGRSSSGTNLAGDTSDHLLVGFGGIGGTISLGTSATLSLTIESGYTPAAGDIFYLAIFNAGTANTTGQFANVNFGTGPIAVTNNTPFSYNGQNWELTNAAKSSTGAFSGGSDIALEVVPVPEPGTWAMLLAGFGILVSFQRRSRHRG